MDKKQLTESRPLLRMPTIPRTEFSACMQSFTSLKCTYLNVFIKDRDVIFEIHLSFEISDCDTIQDAYLCLHPK